MQPTANRIEAAAAASAAGVRFRNRFFGFGCRSVDAESASRGRRFRAGRSAAAAAVVGVRDFGERLRFLCSMRSRERHCSVRFQFTSMERNTKLENAENKSYTAWQEQPASQPGEGRCMMQPKPRNPRGNCTGVSWLSREREAVEKIVKVRCSVHVSLN